MNAKVNASTNTHSVGNIGCHVETLAPNLRVYMSSLRFNMQFTLYILKLSQNINKVK